MNYWNFKDRDKDKEILTLSTCWYNLKSKFDSNMYLKWIKNLLSIVIHFNLVIYTDDDSFSLLQRTFDITNNKKIKIIIKPIEEFYTYKYKDDWISNHQKSNLYLHSRIDWKLNMLWNEKVFFVSETIRQKYFDTPYYGWCDIGYFRNRINDLNVIQLIKWPNNAKLHMFNDNRIHYGCVENNKSKIASFDKMIKDHYVDGQPIVMSEESSSCFAGGFFILQSELIDNYVRLYDEKLSYYFTHDLIIKDDQTIIMDIILTHKMMFYIHTENNPFFDNWFMFQRILS